MIDFKELPSSSVYGGYVYIVESDGRIKIGKSQNIVNRIRMLRTSLPSPITKIHLSPDCANYSEIETHLHRTFKQYRTFGEWFTISFDTAVNELGKCNPEETKSIREIVNRIGELVKQIRVRADISQKDFAVILGVGQSQLSLIESGQRKPGRQVIKKLAELSGLDAIHFID